MNNQEAKFILGAYRPDGRDAGDAMFADSLAQTERDPELRAWFERERKRDAAIAQKLSAIAPPPGLREAILVGARASRPRPRWWRHPGWLAAAAAIAVIATVAVRLQAPSAPAASDLASLALRDLAMAHAEHLGHPAELAGVQAQLANATLPLTRHLPINLDQLREKHCRTVQLGGREVFEICFKRDGTWYHLYAGRRSDFAPGAIDPKAQLVSRGKFTATAWGDGEHIYALVTRAGTDAIQRVI